MATDYTSLINDIGHSDNLVDAERPITINCLSRKIEIPQGFMTQVGVIGDHRSNQVTFQCDRYIDGHDIAACSLAYIKWQNQGAGTADSYIISDREVMATDENKIQFHWEIESDVTTAAGSLRIQIGFMDYDEKGTMVTYRWSSNPNSDLSIGEGMYDPNIDGLAANDMGSFIYSGAISIT